MNPVASRLRTMAVAGMLAGAAIGSAAAAYPDKPIIFVVPYGPGGGVDIVARILARGVAQQLHTNVVVENRPGGGGTIGTAYVARATPDGYTVLIGDVSALTISPALYQGLTYRIAKDFAPLTMVATSSLDIAANSAVKFNNVAEMITYARANPDKLNYSSPGNGTVPHLAAVLFQTMTQTKMTHIPYKSGAEAVNALLAGDVQVSFAQVPLTVAMVPSGRLKVLGVSSAQRSPMLPNTPTIGAAGVPGYSVTSWVAAVVPKATPANVGNVLEQAILAVLRENTTSGALTRAGFDVSASNPADLAKTIASETEKWKKVIKEGGITLQ